MLTLVVILTLLDELYPDAWMMFVYAIKTSPLKP